MNKVLAFIINGDNELLLLRNNPIDPLHGGDFWYTVTGGFDEGETDGYEVAKREIKEETNLEVNSILYLNWIFKYKDQGIGCIEYVYIANVDNGTIILNEENIDYKWVPLNDYIETIKWYGDKEGLKKVLKEGLKKQVYYKEEQIDIYT